MADKAEKTDAPGEGEEGGKKKLPLWMIILIASQVVIVAVVFVSLVNCASTPHKKSVDKVKDVSLVENDIHIMHREQNVIFTH